MHKKPPSFAKQQQAITVIQSGLGRDEEADIVS